MEFSKKWLICSALVSIALIIACAAGADLTEITLAVLAETTASSGFYLWKAKMRTARSTRRSTWINGPRNTARKRQHASQRSC